MNYYFQKWNVEEIIRYLSADGIRYVLEGTFIGTADRVL